MSTVLLFWTSLIPVVFLAHKHSQAQLRSINYRNLSVCQTLLGALYSLFTWSLQQPFYEYYSYLHFLKWARWVQRKQSAFWELTSGKLTFIQTWLLNGNEMMWGWRLQLTQHLSACRSWLGKWAALMWCPQYMKIFYSRGGLLDTSGRPRPKACHSVGVGSDNCILLCLLHNQKWRRTTVYKLPWYAWACYTTVRHLPWSDETTCGPHSMDTMKRARRDRCCSAPREAGSGTSSLW